MVALFTILLAAFPFVWYFYDRHWEMRVFRIEECYKRRLGHLTVQERVELEAEVRRATRGY